MYCCEGFSGKTLFEVSAPLAARFVMLEGRSGGETYRVRMHRKKSRWFVKLALAPGWFFYRFNVDNRLRLDRGAGRLRTGDGQRYNLAIIPCHPVSVSRKRDAAIS